MCKGILTISEDEEIGEDKLKEILSDYSCLKNADVEHFLKCNSIEFTKKNQSVTYLVFGNEGNVVGYFSLAIKPISVRSDIFSNSVNRKISRVAELDEDGTTYSLSAYLIAQLGKTIPIVPTKPFPVRSCWILLWIP